MTGIGNEFYILLDADLKEIALYSNEMIAQAIQNIRLGQVVLHPGYDGIFGSISF
jgi:PHP family Zn ribbon phosphoesterase